MAKKRRRRKDKKDFQPVVQKENESIGSQEFEPKDGYDEEEEYLPDFVIKEDIDPVTTIGTPLPNPETSVVDANAPLTDTGTPKYPTTVDMNDPKVMERIMASMNDPKVMEMMRASKNSMAEKNTKELLLSRNRELEGSVLNDIKEDLPDLSEYMQNKQSFSPKTSASLGKKAARAESRRVAAIEAEEQERQEKEAAKGILSKLPFFKDKEGEPEEDLNPIKVNHKEYQCLDFLMTLFELCYKFFLWDNPPTYSHKAQLFVLSMIRF